MPFDVDINNLRQILTSSNNTLILTRKNPSKDGVAAAVSLHLILEKMGKKIKTACPGGPTVELSQIIGIDKMENNLGQRNLVISLDYVEGLIEKVSYNVEGDKFNLIIHSGENAPSLTPEKVQYSTTGDQFDTVIIIDTPHLELLEHLYEHNKNLYSNIVNIDYHQENSLFGKLNLVDNQSSSVSEILVRLLTELNFELEPDVLSNLFLGIASATQNLHPDFVSSQSLESAAFCLKKGAQRPSSQKKPHAINLTNLSNTSQTPPEEQIKEDWLAPKIYRGTSNLR